MRELSNVLSVAAAAADGCIGVVDVEHALARVGGGEAVREVSLEMILRAITQCAGNQAAAARALGIPRSTLRDRLKSA